MAVTKFQDKFASLRQVNSSNSQDKFQICCTDMCLVEFLANFAVFHVFGQFRGISRIYLNFAAPRPREISEALLIVFSWCSSLCCIAGHGKLIWWTELETYVKFNGNIIL